MCTALNFEGFFGRTLDVNGGYGEQIVLTPKNYPLNFRNGKVIDEHFALLGMAVISDNEPLYFDAVNERGLAGAGLNFPDLAVYKEKDKGKFNLASFELLSYILSVCDSVKMAKETLENINLTNESFSNGLPTTPLHFIFADRTESITVEPVAEGLKVYQNDLGVLTNAPAFLEHLDNLKAQEIIPGDDSSASRFVRMAHFKSAAVKCSRWTHFISVLGKVNRIREENEEQYTLYTSCMDLEKGKYYVKAYDGGISVVQMKDEAKNGEELLSWQYEKLSKINKLN